MHISMMQRALLSASSRRHLVSSPSPSRSVLSLAAAGIARAPQPHHALRCSYGCVLGGPSCRGAFHSTSISSGSSSSSFSSDTSRSQRSHGQVAYRTKLGIGGSKLAHVRPDQYASVVATSLRSAVTTFESGHAGEKSLAEAYGAAMRHFEEAGDELHDDTGTKTLQPVTLTARFGYRTVVPPVDTNNNDGGGGEDGMASSTGSMDSDEFFPNDVRVETKPTSASTTPQESAAEGQAAQAVAHDETDQGSKDGDDGKPGDKDDVTEPTEEETSGVALHNLSREYVAHCLNASPLVKLRREGIDEPKINLIYMAHNPEAQGSDMASKGAPIDEVRGFIKDRLTDAFVGLEMGVAEHQITSYGVCSNGLSLPPAHPLHLPWMDVLEAASDAVGLVHGDDSTTTGIILSDNRVAGLSTVQLPANLLETSGLSVARSVKEYLTSADGDEGDETPPKLPNLPSDVDVYVTRPLTCYPDRGTGTGHPFKLVDYLIDTTTTSDLTSPSTKVWTNAIDGARPPHYGQALATTMGHFDATAILEAGQERKLTVEERETLDGCRLLQSMIHDLDANLDDVRSFAAYEEDLYRKVVPLIHDTFEELDEESAQVLQAFFVAHGAAVRHAIARTTRTLLKEGGEGVPPYDIPDDMTLQEFALQFLLKDDSVNRVIVGCPQPEHVLEAIHAADHLEKDG